MMHTLIPSVIESIILFFEIDLESSIHNRCKQFSSLYLAGSIVCWGLKIPLPRPFEEPYSTPSVRKQFLANKFFCSQIIFLQKKKMKTKSVNTCLSNNLINVELRFRDVSTKNIKGKAYQISLSLINLLPRSLSI